MIKNIWQTLKKPIMVLAPMADVTDTAFRQVIARRGRPDLFFTEFVSADGLMHPKAKDRLKRDLYFSPSEQPIIAQLFTSKPEVMAEASEFVASLGFAGIDINMGCPDRSIEKQGCGSALIKNPTLAQALIKSAKQGSNLPVSVKTRIGYNQNTLHDWTQYLLEAEPSAITFHLRTRKEMSKVPARWAEIKEAVALAKGSQTLILGNGDVKDLTEAKAKAEAYDLAGIMLGRAIYGNPWLFSEIKPRAKEKIEALLEHVQLFDQSFSHEQIKNFAVMKRHFKSYLTGLEMTTHLRHDLMETTTAKEAIDLLRSFLDQTKF